MGVSTSKVTAAGDSLQLPLTTSGLCIGVGGGKKQPQADAGDSLQLPLATSGLSSASAAESASRLAAASPTTVREGLRPAKGRRPPSLLQAPVSVRFRLRLSQLHLGDPRALLRDP